METKLFSFNNMFNGLFVYSERKNEDTRKLHNIKFNRLTHIQISKKILHRLAKFSLKDEFGRH